MESELGTNVEIEEEIDSGEFSPDMDAEFDIDFMQKKITDLREQTINQKRKSCNAINDEENLATELQEVDRKSSTNILNMEKLRNAIDVQRNKYVILEEQLRKSLRELRQLQMKSSKTMKHLQNEKRCSSDKANKMQKDLDHVSSVLKDLPIRFSREKLQAEVSAIREKTEQVDTELTETRRELENLNNRLESYPNENQEIIMASEMSKEVLSDLENILQHTLSRVDSLRQEEKALLN